MKNIEIATTQNVVLQYELASLQDRAIAFFLDLLAQVISFVFLLSLVGAIFGETFAVFILSFALMTYSLVFEVFNNGRTLGKMAMKIQVIKLDGRKTVFSDFAARWIFRLVDIYFSMGGVASLLVMSSSKGQRMGDIIANTAVIKMIPRTNIDLNDLMSIHRSSNYIPTYHQAKKLQEKDALLIKNTLDRYRRYRNHAHRQAVDLLAREIQRLLVIEKIEEQSTFLQTVLNDYVVLSR